MKGSMRQRSTGTWELRYDLAPGADGKRRSGSVTFRGGKREAQTELNRILHELATGVYVEPVKMTVGEYLEYWLENYARSNVAGKTFVLEAGKTFNPVGENKLDSGCMASPAAVGDALYLRTKTHLYCIGKK